MEQYILGYIVNLMCNRMHIDSNQMTNFGLSQAPPAHTIQVYVRCRSFRGSPQQVPAGRPAAGLIPGGSQHPKRPEPQDDRIAEYTFYGAGAWSWKVWGNVPITLISMKITSLKQEFVP